jgi:hypothetical protein
MDTAKAFKHIASSSTTRRHNLHKISDFVLYGFRNRSGDMAGDFGLRLTRVNVDVLFYI